MKHTVAFLLLVLVVAGCSSTPAASPPPTAPTSPAVSTVTTMATPASPSPPTSTPATSSKSAPPPEYPKFVPKSKVDKRYAQFVTGDKMVMLAPGVYAEASPDGMLGTLDDYSAYLVSCNPASLRFAGDPGGCIGVAENFQVPLLYLEVLRGREAPPGPQQT